MYAVITSAAAVLLQVSFRAIISPFIFNFIALVGNKQFGLIDNWLRSIKDVYQYNRDLLNSVEDVTERAEMLYVWFYFILQGNNDVHTFLELS